jgi:hypothetical protein
MESLYAWPVQAREVVENSTLFRFVILSFSLLNTNHLQRQCFEFFGSKTYVGIGS